ncbi:Formylglycine-generating enzyme, required for sulfatase activity, contains SUMF1/FGE domain [Algoriphagus alkaliphilus]|uniref:Formylglycine-generating enzyme, required for sulfatase activity, contains SUMF1/FGE domain n=2 Tax=Algoriphagus alkaliphilus TaxID=279824 RepID=A0A1G5VB24_9BACT|nr:Formylglycine-generating enzyme, required for sulfatase activity, contains SUMF1/FGE domain [Algoriphagus alkaliphilus]
MDRKINAKIQSTKFPLLLLNQKHKKMKALFTILLCLSLSLVFFTHMTYAQTLPEMILVEGGTFQMGDEWGLGDEDELVHEVTLRSFSISKTEVTVGQYKRYCSESGVRMPNPPNWGWIDSHPMVNVSWFDAVNYADWLSEKTGKLYRLPTEAEWEYAARGGKHSAGYKYSGGQSLPLVGWFGDNADGKTHPVAQKRANEPGIYDMSGNVWEWCSDWYGDYPSSAVSNPRGPSSGSDRVLRGGSWDGSAVYCRVSDRLYYDPSGRDGSGGFRVVLSQ